MKYALFSILILILFSGCGYSKAYYKAVNDPNSDYNRYKLWKYTKVYNNFYYEDEFHINSLELSNSIIEVDISYKQNERQNLAGCVHGYYRSNYYDCVNKVILKNEVKFYKSYSLDEKNLDINFLVQNNKCSYDKLHLKREILSKDKIKFIIPREYENSYIKIIFKTKGLKENKKSVKCLNCAKLC